MDRQAVIRAIREAFDLTPEQVEDHLETAEGGRVRGIVVVKGSPDFESLRPAIRTRRMWDRIRQSAPDEPTNLGLVVLLSEEEAAGADLGPR
jgi:hypothetical protein